MLEFPYFEMESEKKMVNSIFLREKYQGSQINMSVEKEQRSKEPKGSGKPPPGQCLQKEKKTIIILNTLSLYFKTNFLKRKSYIYLFNAPNLSILIPTLTLKVVTFPIHEDVVHQDDTKDAGPQMNITEHKNESNIL